MSKFLPTIEFKWIDSEECDLNKCRSNSSKGYFPEVDLKYSKELWELHKDYPLVPDKIDIKKRNAFWVSTKDFWFIQCS